MKSSSFAETFYRSALFIALAAATVAMFGSLYFSEVRHYLPCNLCWYQRILMYPLVGIIAIGLLRQDNNLPYYVLPFSLLGQGFSTYHYLLEKTSLFPAPTTCQVGIPCTTAWINWFGFITIPFLAMVAFFIITVMALLAMTAGEPATEENRPSPWLQVASVITATALVFVLIYQLDPQRASLALSTPAAGEMTPVATPTLVAPLTGGAVAPIPIDADHADTHDAATLATGATLYAQSCVGCHGPAGAGIPNLAPTLVASQILLEGSDAEVLAYIRAGVLLNDPNNQSGLVMPPSGGRPDLSDEEMLAIIAYLRSLTATVD
jgi:disulfide bond formation protein DsbB